MPFIFNKIAGLVCKGGNSMGKILPFPLISREFGRGSGCRLQLARIRGTKEAGRVELGQQASRAQIRF